MIETNEVKCGCEEVCEGTVGVVGLGTGTGGEGKKGATQDGSTEPVERVIGGKPTEDENKLGTE